jgi:hypothetical protein
MIIRPAARNVGMLRGSGEKEFQIMCSICATVWVMVDGVLEPVVVCTKSMFGC